MMCIAQSGCQASVLGLFLLGVAPTQAVAAEQEEEIYELQRSLAFSVPGEEGMWQCEEGGERAWRPGLKRII